MAMDSSILWTEEPDTRVRMWTCLSQGQLFTPQWVIPLVSIIEDVWRMYAPSAQSSQISHIRHLSLDPASPSKSCMPRSYCSGALQKCFSEMHCGQHLLILPEGAGVEECCSKCGLWIGASPRNCGVTGAQRWGWGLVTLQLFKKDCCVGPCLHYSGSPWCFWEEFLFTVEC